ncbi:MAG TPA: hypothetical protein VHW96_04955 [Solirubrobacteraceae bacterium]|jgi:hypothetical protein|nr:hypothetical protein [Solirubrobacteraceae bacterium]
MLTLIKRTLAAAIVIAAVATPTAAYARTIDAPPGARVAVAPPQSAGTPNTDQAVATSSSGFQWGDAGIGAGSLLVLISVGSGAAVAYRRRAHPLAS